MAARFSPGVIPYALRNARPNAVALAKPHWAAMASTARRLDSGRAGSAWQHADSRQQIRLKPSDARYLRNDFTDFVEQWRPSWSSDIGQPVRDPGSLTLDELQAAFL
ncbi:hypothetical protein AB0G73_33215 [Streptomyces sp. NPDC020719]|uniref:hypothetical protein n=1 Tax=Streptomyces sp. NPDC020719 TaxID=3154896 RepID=UPI0033CCAB2A